MAAGPIASAAASTRQQPLSLHETATLVAWCDVIVPGAQANGVGDFVNAQLAKHEDETLLSIRYFNEPPPFDAYYRRAIAAIDASSLAAYGVPFVRATTVQRSALVDSVIAGTAAWSGPPAFVFYLVTRSDGVDAVYGTAHGYRRLDYPYDPQVTPPRPW